MKKEFMRNEGDPLYVPPGGPPQVPIPSPEIYKQMGEENIMRMTQDFYAELESSSIRGMFPDDMKEASKKLGAFLVFRLGGPPRYQERYGQPQLRSKHVAFKIDEKARLIWLNAFKKTLENADTQYNFPKQHLPGFWTFIEAFSIWMLNTQ